MTHVGIYTNMGHAQEAVEEPRVNREDLVQQQSESAKMMLESAPRRIYTPTALRELTMADHPADVAFATLVNTLIKHRTLTRIELKFPSRARIFFTVGKVPLEAVLMQVDKNAYLCHSTAASIHGLTARPSNSLYVNVEQKLTSSPHSTLEQARIDAAFRKHPRTSNNVAKAGKKEVTLLNSKNTGQLGVVSHVLSSGNSEFTVRITDLERTLIDMATRPFYAGGPEAVLYAYRKAAGQVDTPKLAAMLESIQHIYPYHQAIGFYMDRTGKYKADDLDLFRRLGMEYDFYLTNQMKQTRFVSEWRIHVPIEM